MKVYLKQGPGFAAASGSNGAIDVNTWRKYVWPFIDAIVELEPYVVSDLCYCYCIILIVIVISIIQKCSFSTVSLRQIVVAFEHRRDTPPGTNEDNGCRLRV